MERTIVEEGESLDMLSARLGVPGCMILRANGLFTDVWLLPGREIDVPDADYCQQAQNVCPVLAMNEPALSVRAGRAIRLNHGEEAARLAERLGRSQDELRLLLPLTDRLTQGAEVFVPSPLE